MNPRSTKLSNSGATVTFGDTDDWGSGFVGSVSLTNISATGLNGWTIAFDLAANITNIWNAQIVSHVGTHYVIKAAAWNATLAPGATISFGFQADAGNPVLPSSAVLNGQALSSGSVIPPPLPTLAIAGASVTEGSAATLNETFTVTLSAASATPVTVAWHTANGTALAGTDYTAASGTLTFAAGVTSQKITVATHPGAAGSHAYSVVLANPTGATLATASATGTIVDPTPPPLPKLTIASASVTEGTAASLSETFTVTLSAASATPVTVAWHTANGTALAGTDYAAASGTLTFAAGVTSQKITVTTHPGAVGTHAYSVVLASPTGATLATATATGTIVDPAVSLPSISVGNVTVDETGAASTAGRLLPAGYLSTSGNQIVDANGNPVKIAAVNWFGAETSNFTPHGLWAESYQSMMNQMVQLGFNTIRLPFSLQLFDPSSTPNSINFALNPDLQGLNGLQILDKIVAYAGQIGLKIILDDHRSAAGNGPNGDGLWYDGGYTAQQWVSDWQMLAQHYANNPTVIGADLLNEPHGAATWGDGGPNDWAAAATKAGDAIQAVNSNWLIFVEGIESYQGQSTWWGGNLMGVAQHPITLTDPNKLVYSPHEYPASVYNQSWFSDPSYPNNLPAVWNKFWGYIYNTDTAPVWIGEFGTNLQTTSDQQWLAKLISYVDGGQAAAGGPSVAAGQQGISWAYWSWNPDSSDTGGILQNDWQTVNQAKVTAITPAMYHPSGSGSGGSTPSEVDFTVRLSAASSSAVTVHYATMDGTAHAGVDYVAASGNLTFAPGETVQIIKTQLLADPSATGSLSFLVALSSPSNGTLASPSATATLVHPAAAVPPPPPPPPATVAGGASLHVDSDWGSGLTATVTIANQGHAASLQWQVEIDTKDLIGNLWNGTILSHQGTTYIVGNDGSNGRVAAGGSTSFGFQASETPGASLAAHLLSMTA